MSPACPPVPPCRRATTPATAAGSCPGGSCEGSDPRDVAPDDERLHGGGALVGVDDLDVAHVEPGERIDRAVDERGDLGLVGHVTGDAERPVADVAYGLYPGSLLEHGLIGA